MGATVLLSLIVLGSSAALSALLSLIVASLYSSYLIVCTLLLWRRCTGYFRPYSAGSSDEHDVLSWGPWRIPEPIGTINNFFACVYTVFMLFWSFWPQTSMPTPESFNWSVLVFGAVIIFSVVWYTVRAKTYFKGPIKEV